MKHATLSIAIATALSAATVGYAPLVLAAPAATVLFTQDGAQIVGADGKSRPAKQGDVVQSGERLQNPPNTVTQLLLTDGSLIGMRPASEVKIDVPAGTGPNTPGAGQTISLVDGAVRVIGSELMNKQKPSALTLQTGQATLKLNAADLESAVVRPDAPKTGAPSPTGSYSRLQTGSGSIQSGAASEVLAPRQVSFVGASNAAPIQVASVSPALFASNVLAAPNATAGAARPVRPTDGPGLPAVSALKTPASNAPTPNLLQPAMALQTPTIGADALRPPVTTTTAIAPPLTVAIAPTVSPSIAPLINSPAAVAPAITTPIATAPIVSPTLTFTPPIISTPPTQLATATPLAAPTINTATLTMATPVIAPVTPKPTTTFIAPVVTLTKVTCTPVVIRGVKRCI